MASERGQQPPRERDAARRWPALSDEWAAPLGELRQVLGMLAPPVLAALVFAGGLVLMLSGSLPEAEPSRTILRDLLPLPFAEASHLSASLAGLALVVVSRGLFQRMAKAHLAATLFLAAGAVFALLRGLDWREAGLLAGLAVILVMARGAFYRRGDWRSFRPSRGWIALAVGAVLAAAAIGLIGHRSVEYRNDLWWSFAWHGDAPRFLRATLAMAVVVAGLALDRLLNRPVPASRAPMPVPDAVRRLLADCPDSARQLALLGDKKFLIAPGADAFLMYGVRGQSWICLGGPVGNPAAATRLVWQFADLADRAGARPVFCAISGDRIGQLLDLGHVIAKMGEIARVDLAAFTLDGPRRKDLRYARARAVRDGLSFAVLPKAEVPGHMDELRAISDAWLATRKGREKGFALGYFDPAYLAEFGLAVMRHDGRIVAFANIWRGAGKAEMAVDLMRHAAGESPVMMEAFFVELFLYAQAEGYRWFLLGGAPMSGMPVHRMAPAWARIGALIFRHGDEFYSFGGLRAFKQKFDPVWTPIYLTCPSSLSLPQVLFDIALLVTRGRDDD
jgi:phosphatidylglycerol lysyltransferase